MDPNYDRLVSEINSLRRRMADLEHANFELSRTVYFLKQRELQRQIDDYLEHYMPLSERKKQEKK